MTSHVYKTIKEAEIALDIGQAYYDANGSIPSNFRLNKRADKSIILTHDRLLKTIHYDPLTGIFTSKRRGKPLGSLSISGYVSIAINEKCYLAHRLAIFYMTGEFPPDEMSVDHNNNIRSDNSWENLSIMDASGNNLKKHSTSKTRGITRTVSPTGMIRFLVSITVRKKRNYLGSFETFDDAALAWDKFVEENDLGIHCARDNTIESIILS